LYGNLLLELNRCFLNHLPVELWAIMAGTASALCALCYHLTSVHLTSTPNLVT